ncbi:MAG: hypothetical protein HXL55_01915 [Solobacterium sp.]|nr:hypothetical protein [Solobacterium sp.]
MKTLHIFLEKELKETIKHKRIFSLVPILILFLPLLNQYIPHSFMTGISPSVFLPYSYLLIGAYSTEFIFEMMNNEYRQKTIEIIWTCKISPVIFLFAKMIIPVFIGVILFFSSILLNNILFSIFNQGAYYILYNFWYIVFGILTVVLTNISTLTIYLKFNQIITREAYTLTAFITGLIVLLIYLLGCTFGMFLAVLIYLCTITTLFLYTIVLFSGQHIYNQAQKPSGYLSNNWILILLQNCTIHTLHLKKVGYLLLMTIGSGLFIKELQLSLPFITNLLLITLFGRVATDILLRQYILGRRLKIDEIVYVSRISNFAIHILYFSVYILLSLVFLIIFHISFWSLSNIVIHLLIIGLVGLFTVLLSRFADISHEKISIGIIMLIVEILTFITILLLH